MHSCEPTAVTRTFGLVFALALTLVFAFAATAALMGAVPVLATLPAHGNVL